MFYRCPQCGKITELLYRGLHPLDRFVKAEVREERLKDPQMECKACGVEIRKSNFERVL